MAKNNNLRNIAIGATGLALAAAAAAAAGAVLSNKELRGKLGKKAAEALATVNKLAMEVEKGAQGSLKMLGDSKSVSNVKSSVKKSIKKTAKKSSKK